MTERERVLAILNHQQPDQLPWMAEALAVGNSYFSRECDLLFLFIQKERNFPSV